MPTVDDEIDGLYARPLTEFIAARNALASALKKSGHGAASAVVKSLEKPTVSAWAANLVYWHARAEYDALLGAGAALREAQQALLGGTGRDEMTRAMAARDEALVTALRAGVEQAARAGTTLSSDVRERLRATLDALAALGGTQMDRPGRLVRDLDPPGLSVLSLLTPAAGPAPRPALRLVHSAAPTPHAKATGGTPAPAPPNPRRLAQLRRELADAEQTRDRLRDQVEAAAVDERAHRAEFARVTEEHDAASAELAALTAKVKALATRVSRAGSDKDRAAAEAARLRAKLDERERLVADARAALDRLEDGT